MPNLDSRVGRYLGVLAAAALLAGVSADASAYGSQGRIRLQLGGGQQSRFVYENATGTAVASQAFKVQPGTKCFLGWVNGTKDLVSFDAIGPTGAVSPQLGMGPDSIGVYDNSKGVSCYRMTGSIHEGVDLALDGQDLPSGTYFDRLELDVEVKQNAKLFLDVFKNDVRLNSYELRSGNRIDPLVPSSDTIFNCGANSDSGPDSGPSDNCRWVINDIGNRFKLRPAEDTDSEVSLEGGGDFSDTYANNTVIFLTKLIDTGELYCSPNTDPAKDNKTEEVGGGPVASCQTTRINPNNLAGQADICQGPIKYELETYLGQSRCELRKKTPADGQVRPVQLAGSLQITFKPEGSEESGYAPTTVTFTKNNDNDQSAPMPVSRCEGTRVQDANGNWTILEVLSPTHPLTGTLMAGHFVATVGGGPDTLTDATDEVRGNGIIDWACVLNDSTEYLGDGTMQVTQTILYWGDINWNRL